MDFHHRSISATNIAPAIASEPDVITTHAAAAKDTVIQLDNKYRVRENQLLSDPQFPSFSSDVQLARLVYYLRRVHLVCFYCGTGFGDEAEMHRRCSAHLRAPLSEKQTGKLERCMCQYGFIYDDSHVHSAYEQFLNTQRTRLQNWLQREVDQESKRDRAENREIEYSLVEKHDTERFKCAMCPKVFKGAEFVVKHIRTRHTADEQVEKILNVALEKLFFDNYRDDPRRITPPAPSRHRSPAKYSIHSPHARISLPPPAPFSTPDPRGIRDYRDLDAPMDEVPVVMDFHAPDYSTPPVRK